MRFADRPYWFFAGSESDPPGKGNSAVLLADQIVNESVWELAGFGRLAFVGDNVWRRDPLGTLDWGLEYHADVVTFREAGADVRVLWELNRFGHALLLAQAFVETSDERFANEYFSQVEEWIEQNPYGRGANWHSAMEVALRAINLLAAFDVFRRSESLTQARLAIMLQLFDQHGRFIFDNNEFSYLATSNHYLSNVVGLFWIGVCLPELEKAAAWREFGLREMLIEIDKQILADGVDFEASTGYHKFVTEMLMYTFLLARRNSVEIAPRYWEKLRQMLSFLSTILRPDGRMTLVGDADGSQIIPLLRREADDAAYLLAVGEAMFDEPGFCAPEHGGREIAWMVGDPSRAKAPEQAITEVSAQFPEAGMFVMRDGDLHLHFNATDCGIGGRGSHAHNDALSVEMSAFGRAFIIDPGSYVYNLDREARHLFRSTGVHSTVMVDGEEQNSTETDEPFVIGNESAPRIISWCSSPKADRVEAEHFGYTRFAEPVVHRRTIEFDKTGRHWTIRDDLQGVGSHDLTFRFHLAPGVSARWDDGFVEISDAEGRRLLIKADQTGDDLGLEPAYASRNYGHREASSIIRWDMRATLPVRAFFFLVPSGPDDNYASRLELLHRLSDNG